MTLRILQWATGTVGKHVIRAIAATPGLELAGVLAYDPAKAGIDAGTLCGIDPLGIAISIDPEAIFSMDADCVIYTAQGEGKREQVLHDVCRLLASGKNVISTALTELIYPKACGPEIVARLEQACHEGQRSFHATGIEPGWAADVLPLAMSGLFRRIDHLLVQEIFDYSTYPSAETIVRMGFGSQPHPVQARPMPMEQGGAFIAPLCMVADALGAEIEAIVYDCEFALADRDQEICGVPIAKGTVTGKRYSFAATIAGRTAMTIEHVTRLGPNVAPEWPKGRGWYVTVEGTPSMALSCEIGLRGEDQNDQACIAAALHAVHAVAPVCAAMPGIRTFLDLPVIMGKGAFTREAN